MNLELIISIFSFIIAIVLHEYAHGYSAYLLGDPTAKYHGRLTLNPLAHIDPIGLITMFIFRFGWAKGVPVNSNNFKNKRLGKLIVSSAGILTNYLIAFLSLNILYLQLFNNFYINLFLYNLGVVNVMLGTFNLLPIPPLDGSKILLSFLPEYIEIQVYKHGRIFNILLVLLIVSGYINKILPPLINRIVEVLIVG